MALIRPRSSQRGTHAVPTAREIMKPLHRLVTLSPEMPILEAVRILLKNRISGAPVLDGEGRVVGVCSELDCLRVLSAGEFWRDDHSEGGRVADTMTTDFLRVEPDRDVYALAQFFLTHAARRLIVAEGDEAIGQLSRRDVLAAIERFAEQRTTRRHYPDYREPAADVGARRSHG